MCRLSGYHPMQFSAERPKNRLGNVVSFSGGGRAALFLPDTRSSVDPEAFPEASAEAPQKQAPQKLPPKLSLKLPQKVRDASREPSEGASRTFRPIPLFSSFSSSFSEFCGIGFVIQIRLRSHRLPSFACMFMASPAAARRSVSWFRIPNKGTQT